MGYGGGYGGDYSGYGGGGNAGYDAYGGGYGGYGGGYGGYDDGFGYGGGYGYDGYGEDGGRTIDNYMPRDCSDCVFVSGLPTESQKTDISNHFCRAGTILVTKGVQRIFMFMDKSKEPTGECTVTYENPESAARAIEMFHGKEFNGANLTVQIATPEQKQPFANKLLRDAQKQGGYGGYGGFGGFGGRGRGRGGPRGGGFRGGPMRGGPRGGFRGGRGGPGFRGGRGRGGGRPAPY